MFDPNTIQITLLYGAMFVNIMLSLNDHQKNYPMFVEISVEKEHIFYSTVLTSKYIILGKRKILME